MIRNSIFLLIALMMGVAARPAFAIDQVTLTNGQVVQGKVLNDVPNRFVDLQTTNGNTRRFERAEVASVDRDVPNLSKDREMFGNQSGGFVSLLAGGYVPFGNNVDKTVLFDYGIKAGLVAPQMGDFARWGFALSFDRVSRSILTGFESTTTVAYNDLNFQMLLMRVGNSGFYFGPNIGLAIITQSGDFGNSNSNTRFEAGAGLGYDAYLSDSFSIGPDVRYEHIFGDVSGNVIKFALNGSFHF